MKQKKIQYLQSDLGQKELTRISFDEHIFKLRAIKYDSLSQTSGPQVLRHIRIA